MYSDGVTEAENPEGQPFDEIGRRSVIDAHRTEGIDDLGATIFAEIERYAQNTKLADDLTVLAVLRLPAPPAE